MRGCANGLFHPCAGVLWEDHRVSVLVVLVVLVLVVVVLVVLPDGSRRAAGAATHPYINMDPM